jgi:UDP-GlcNAc:undecaprenyl-phosphate GlcNAc-1-phosphate transferase
MPGISFYLLAAAVVFATSALATFCVREAARRFAWVERPRPDRWHTGSRAKLGGVAIWIALLIGVGLFQTPTRELVGLLVLATLMFAVGIVDDFRRLRPQTMLVIQVAGALALFVVGFHFNPAVPFAVDLAFVLLWVVGITNAMNLLDNMDGLSAGIAVIACGFRFLLYYTDGNAEGALLTAIFTGAVGGFLLFNFGRASIFMGNCGSFLIGFVLAALNLTTAQTYAKSLLSVLFFPVLVLAIPIFDTTFVSLMRYFSGRKVSRGGADHASHRLVAVGLSERQAVLILYAISFTSGLIAYFLYLVGFSYAVFAAALCVLGLALFGVFLSTVSVYPEDRVPGELAGDAGKGITLWTEVTHKRAMLWILLDVFTLALAYYAGYLFRFGRTPDWEIQFLIFARSAPFFIGSVLLALFARGLYRTEWRYFSLHEIKIVVLGVTLGAVASTLLCTYLFRFDGFSQAVLLMAWSAAVLALAGTRAFVRLLGEVLRRDQGDVRRVLIYGAGDGGRLALAELEANRSLGQKPIGFIDDDPAKHRTTLRGVPVLGGVDALEFLIKKHRIDAIVVAARDIDPERHVRLEQSAARCGTTLYRASLEVVPLERAAV